MSKIKISILVEIPGLDVCGNGHTRPDSSKYDVAKRMEHLWAVFRCRMTTEYIRERLGWE